MQQNNAGGGGSQTARNFTEMFELEMDLEKSQYESESQLSTQNAQQDLDEAIRKLKELAERQEKLAQEQSAGSAHARAALETGAAASRSRGSAASPRGAESQQQSARRFTSSSRGGSASRAGARSGEERGSRRSSSVAGTGIGQQGAAGHAVGQRQRKRRSAPGRAIGPVAVAGSESRAGSEPQSATRACSRSISPEPSRFDETLEQFADRGQQMLDEQRRIETDLYEALSQPQPSQRARHDRSTARAGAGALEAADGGDLTNLERDMRNAVHENRKSNPETHAPAERDHSRPRRLGHHVSAESQRRRDLLRTRARSGAARRLDHRRARYFGAGSARSRRTGCGAKARANADSR